MIRAIDEREGISASAHHMCKLLLPSKERMRGVNFTEFFFLSSLRELIKC